MTTPVWVVSNAAFAIAPVLPAPKFSLPGLALPYAMNSFRFCAGSVDRMTKICGFLVRPVIGSKSPMLKIHG